MNLSAIGAQQAQRAQSGGSGELVRGQFQGLAVAARPSSPVDDQLSDNHALLMELEAAVNQLIQPLRSILSRDPREPAPEANVTPAAKPISCELERILFERNASLRVSIRVLREVQDAIRL